MQEQMNAITAGQSFIQCGLLIYDATDSDEVIRALNFSA